MAYKKIVWISLDALRADCIGNARPKLYEREHENTVPLERTRLDELCEESFVFSNTISAAPYTSASHASYFTGLWPAHHGVYDQFNSRLRAKTIFEYAREHGYATLFKTDSPFLLGKYLNMVRGVDEYIAEENGGLVERIARDRKLFAFIHFAQFHYPYGFHNLDFGGKEYVDTIEKLEKKYSIHAENANFSDLATETFRSEEDLNLLHRYKKVITYLYSKKMDGELFNLYLEGVNRFHARFLNGFLDELRTALDPDEYLLVVSSDHGEAWSDETYGHHNSIEEGALRVLLAFNAKDIVPGVYANRVRTIDVFPTLMENAFGEKAECDGKSLGPCVYGRKTEPDRFAFSAVWITDLGELVRKAESIAKTDTIRVRNNVSSKYSAAAYEGGYKCEVVYKRFANRSQQLVDDYSEKLYRIDSPVDFTAVDDPPRLKRMVRLIEAHNNPQAGKKMGKTETLERYFNLLGYPVGRPPGAR